MVETSTNSTLGIEYLGKLGGIKVNVARGVDIRAGRLYSVKQ